jgi:hypothetical protein
MRTVIGATVLTLLLALAPTAGAKPDASLGVSGDMTPNADGSASFEFRVANNRADVAVTGFTVTVAFYDRAVAPGRKLAEYKWSFVSNVPPNEALLEYGRLDAKAAADLATRYAKAGNANAGPLATAVYTYEARVDAATAVPAKQR